MVPLRRDIQFLRGVAVIAVVAYHVGWLPGGLLGVDVFFVISGFLMGRMILSDPSFSLRGFYARRARRLLPASLSTLFVTTLLALWLLTSAQWRDYLWQLLGSVTFSTNFVLAAQSGYFDAAAETKPLLHMWSLAVEEQFYLLLPLALLLFRPRMLVWACLASFALWVAMTAGVVPIGDKSAQTLAFYMLPTRAWQLLVGTVAAWVMLRRSIAVPFAVKWAALAGVGACFAFRWEWAAPIVTLLTAAMLLGSDGWIPKTPIERIGDWSYSLYLVHWPLIAFATVAYMETPPAWVRLALVVISVGLAWAQYTFVEQRFRKARIPSLAWSAAAIAVLAAPGISHSRPTDVQKGLSPSCDQQGPVWQALPECVQPGAKVAVWGDSYAMHLVPALSGVAQYTKSACIPIPGVAHARPGHSVEWSRQCDAFNRSVLDSLTRDPNIETVVISSPFAMVLEDRGQQLVVDGQSGNWSPVGKILLLQSVRALQAAGKRVVIVGPTPRASFDAGACNNRLLERRPILGRDGCSISRTAAEEAVRATTRTLREVAHETGASLILPFDALCEGGGVCRTSVYGRPLYSDEDHLTPEGARLILQGSVLTERPRRAPA